MTISKEASLKIKNMGLFCAALVVARHLGLGSTMSIAQKLCKYFIVDGIAMIAVPFFFIVSGYFVTAELDQRSYS